MDSIGIALIGYGMIGRVHSLAYHELPIFYPGQLPRLRLVSVCTGHPETAQAAAAAAGYASWSTDYKELLGRDDVDVIDCSVPNYMHKSLILGAIAAGKHVYCEKPLALDGAEARELVAAAAGTGVRIGMAFNYRFLPAMQRARGIIEAGQLGQIYHFRAEYLHTGYQDPNRPMGWKATRARAGGGAIVDLGSHVTDLLRYLMGEFTEVLATTRTYIGERPVRKGSAERQAVDVDDVAWLQARMANGAQGTIEVSRFATGRLDELRLEMHGELGALSFNLADPNWLYFYDATRPGQPIGGEQGWVRLETMQNYDRAAAPPARSNIGWTRSHAENQYAFLRALATGAAPVPDIIDGLRTQLVMDAAYDAARTGRWTEVPLA